MVLGAIPAAADPIVCTRRVLARFVNSPDDPANMAVLSQYGASISWRAHMVPGLVSINCPELNAVSVAQALSASSNVKYAETFTSDNDPWTANPCQGHSGNISALPLTADNVQKYHWARKNYGDPIANVVGTVGADLNAIPAWQVTTGSPEIVVAVIDAGISINHPALVNSLWSNPNEITGDNIDNDANGIVDDIHGVKFGMSDDEQPLVTGDPRPPNNANDESWSHGTSAAGLIFAAPSSGIHGIAPGCKLMSLSILQFGFSFEYDLYPERIAMALDYSMYMGARVTSLSLTQPEQFPTAFLELLEVAESIDHLFVVSAGNNHCNCDTEYLASRFPAAHSLDYPAIIGVAATDNNDCLAIYDDAHAQGCGNRNGSNFGAQTIFIGAPGWRNVSLRMMPNPSRGLYDWFGGTSAAAPHVAGAVALLLSIHPEYTCAEIKDKLAQAGRSVQSLDGITISGKTLDIGALINP